jgi:hypothetical protein
MSLVINLNYEMKAAKSKRVPVTLTSSQLAALSRVFSSAVFHDLAKRGRSALLYRLLNQSSVLERCDTHSTIADAFDATLSMLKSSGARDEYVFRSALTGKVLLGRHSLRTAAMLNEFRAGDCKADIVILNGTATVYEIKSERDSLARLENQIANYQKVFASVNVVVSEGHVAKVAASMPRDVGVLELSRRFTISVIREATDRPDQVCPLTIFESLRTGEAVSILAMLGRAAPDVPNTRLRTALRHQFAYLAPSDVHAAMVSVLKSSRSLLKLSDLVQKLPASLHAAALSVPLREGDRGRLLQAVATPIHAAAAWSA